MRVSNFRSVVPTVQPVERKTGTKTHTRTLLKILPLNAGGKNDRRELDSERFLLFLFNNNEFNCIVNLFPGMHTQHTLKVE